MLFQQYLDKSLLRTTFWRKKVMNLSEKHKTLAKKIEFRLIYRQKEYVFPQMLVKFNACS